MAKTYVIGDIHGCHDSLQELFKSISPDLSQDTIIFLGDYIDRGPHSKKVVSFVIRLPSGQYVLSGMIDLYKVFPAAGMAFTTSPANAFRECVAKMLQVWDIVE